LITDVFRSCPLLCTIHCLINFTLASVETVPSVPAGVDKGHQSKHTVSKLILFLQMLEHLQADRNEPTNEIYLPMDRSDISEYVGASLSAISRAFRTLSAKGILKVRNRRHVKIIDRAAFEPISHDVRLEEQC
jgi:CRP-like cAMP-binding protein